jgi:RimJ/RimL family protein N-acetyltransferase/N-acetylglutamate synthase-like GNAT family acetyltransferase
MVEIRPAVDTDAEGAAAILREVDDARVLSAASWLHLRRTSSPEDRVLNLVADDGEVIAVGLGGLNRWTAEAGRGWCNIAVTGSRRCEGIGSALLDRLLRHFEDIGVAKATTFFRQSEEGERWALARGWARLLSGPLVAVDPRTVTERAVPPGFRIASMAEAGPEAVYDAVLEAAPDEPRPEPVGQLPYEDFIRGWNQPDVDLDVGTVVFHGDRVVAFTEMRIAGDRAQHGFTGCRRDYRGQGLATLVKTVALTAAAARGVTRVTTSNADENAAMRAVNRKLGFAPFGEHVIFGRDLD